ncbi:MAG: LEA type 2 family protein [Steroidobacteraceae bacterium]
MPNPSLRVPLLLVLALLAASCSTLSDLQAPRVELLGVQVMSADMFAQRFKVRLLVQNPNDVELPVKGIDYKIIMMGDSFADGMSTERFVLPAMGEAEFDTQVTTNFVSSFGRLLSRVGGGKLENVDYEIAGDILLDKGVLRKIPFSHRGTVDFEKVLGGTKKGEI